MFFANCAVVTNPELPRPQVFLRVCLPWQVGLVTWNHMNPSLEAISHFDGGRPVTSIRLFEGGRHFLLIFASLRNRFIFFYRQQLMFAHHYAPTDNHSFHIVSLQRIG